MTFIEYIKKQLEQNNIDGIILMKHEQSYELLMMIGRLRHINRRSLRDFDRSEQKEIDKYLGVLKWNKKSTKLLKNLYDYELEGIEDIVNDIYNKGTIHIDKFENKERLLSIYNKWGDTSITHNFEGEHSILFTHLFITNSKEIYITYANICKKRG